MKLYSSLHEPVYACLDMRVWLAVSGCLTESERQAEDKKLQWKMD